MLPIEELIPAIIRSLRECPNLVIEAAPGAGKTTRVPRALLEFGEVLVLEPRRIAARLAARRVASEMGERVGETVGFQVRFEEVAGPATRLRFLTEGVLTRRLISDPELSGIGVVVLDEFHERHLETDLALALLLQMQKAKRPDLRIVVMSATLEAGAIARFLGECPVFRSAGRVFDLAIHYTAYSPAPLEEQVAGALERLLVEEQSGDVLVFLPGAGEIRKASRACEAIGTRQNLLIAPLYGDLSAEEQDRAIARTSRRKVILSTNIAESSITIEGVRAVIDSGLARIASDSPWTGLPMLEVKRISQASAAQRAGRAGRTGPGCAIRLYTAEDFQRRRTYDEPEILRRELSQMCLQLEVAGVDDPLRLDWLDAPPPAALKAAEELLNRLRARGDAAARMARLPTHPRLARLILAAEALAAADHGCRVAALLSSGQRLKTLDDDPDQGSLQVYRQLRRYVKGGRGQDDVAVQKALLCAFPDRVARRGQADLVVAVDPDRLASSIEPEWLIDYFPERVRDRSGVEWNRQAERVESVSALTYDDIVIEESRGGPMDDDAASKLLAAKVIEAGIERFVDGKQLDAFLARVEFASEHGGVGRISEDDVTAALTGLCYGLRSFGDVEKNRGRLIPALERSLDTGLLEQIAPARLRLPSGRNTMVNYERGKPPWVASRLQDFFGMTETPRIARGAVPLLIHLLAPNQRAVQTTTDLAGFWTRLYPQLRRELSRRYPRHAWPERPV